MNSYREKILKQINDTPTEEIGKVKVKKNIKKEIKEFVKDLILGPFRVIGGILGVSEENVGTHVETTGHGGGHAHSNSKGSTFKDDLAHPPFHPGMINPIDVAGAKAYAAMIDGHGDPPKPCDCKDER